MKSPVSVFINENESSDILQRISMGEDEAISECLDKYGRLIWSLSRKFTCSREDAEDAVQDIFIDIWKYAARFDAAKSPEGAFVNLIARRRLIDRLRKSRSQTLTSISETTVANRPSDDHKKLQMYVEMKYAVDAIDKLGASQRQLVKMAIYGGMTHSEISKTIGLPLGTVKSQLRRGFQKIRTTLEIPITPIPRQIDF